METTLQYGQHVTQSDTEVLKAISIEQIHHLLTGKEGDMPNLIRRLRAIRRLDQKAFERAKSFLPYICCSCFASGIRNEKNFLEAYGMILDLDKCFDNQKEAQELKHKLRTDPHIALMYDSPGGNGIKAVLLFDQPVTDAPMYKHIYKHIASSFGQLHQVTRYIDFKTHDTTRVSFLSHDPEAWLNPVPVPIDTKSCMPDLSHQHKQDVAEVPQAGGIAEQDYERILQLLGTRKSAKPKPAVFVPEELQYTRQLITEAVAQFGIEVSSVADMQYGLKFRFRKGLHLAEINLFYGKKGYTVVISPKRDTHPKLNELIGRLIEQVIYSLDTNLKVHEEEIQKLIAR